MDRWLGLDKPADDPYTIQTSGYDKFEVSRRVHDIPVALQHETLHDGLTGTPQVLEDLQSLVDRDALPPSSITHLVVAAAHGTAVVPLAFFCDGALFLAFWIQNLISGNHALACVLRKSSLCQCGCRGYFALFPVLNVPRWSIGVILTGYFPSTDHSLSRRGALAAKAGVIYIKGDWMEYVTTLSFPSWTHNVHPRPMLFCSPDTMCDLMNFALEGAYCDLTTTDHYIEECERREIHVVVDGSGHAKIRNSLEHHTPSGTRWTRARGQSGHPRVRVESPRQVGANTMDVRLCHVRRHYPLPSTVRVLVCG